MYIDAFRKMEFAEYISMCLRIFYLHSANKNLIAICRLRFILKFKIYPIIARPKVHPDLTKV